MRPVWKECPRETYQTQWATIYVTINSKGYIVLGKTTYKKLDAPKAFLLLFDGVNNRIGLKPTGLAIKNAFPVCVSGKHGGKMVRAFRLLVEFGIEIKETLQFHDAQINEDGVLILDLRSARVSARAGMGRRVAGQKAQCVQNQK